MQLKNVKIINHNTTINNANISIANGVITKIDHLPGEGKLLVVPGFIDSHIHGFYGKDSMGSADDLKFIAAKLKAVGTTAFLATIMTAPIATMHRCLQTISQVKSLDARILGVHVEGPFISLEKKGAHDPRYIIAPTPSAIMEMQKAANGFIRKMTVAPELCSDDVFIAMRQANIVISIGHTNGTAEDVARAVKLGATSATHLWNAMTGVANRQPGIAEGVLNRHPIYAEMILDMRHLDQETMDITFKMKGPKRIVAVTDALTAAGLPDGDYVSGGLPVTKRGDIICLKGTSTIAGSGATMAACFRNAVHMGWGLQNAVAITSYNPSLNLKVKNLGVIAQGYQADMVVMDHQLNIVQVLVDGK